MSAIIRGDGAMTELLLSWGVDVNAQDDEGVSALMMAARDGNAALLQQVLGRGPIVDARSRIGWTALTYAAWKGHPDVARRLLKAGADPTHRDRSNWTALMHVTSRAAEIGVEEPSAVVDSLDTRTLSSRDAARRRYSEMMDLLAGASKGRGTNRPVAAPSALSVRP